MSKHALTVIPRLTDGDDAAIARTLCDLHHGAMDGTRRVIALGLFCQFVKLTKLKHGQFRPWLEANCPGITWRSIQSHMQLAASVMEAVGFKSLEAFFQMRSTLRISHGGEILLLPRKDLPDDLAAIGDKISEIIDGKSARQLFLQFKQTDEDGNPRAGRRKGEGGKKAMSLEDQLAAKRVAAGKFHVELGKSLDAYGALFMFLPSDEDIMAEIAEFDRQSAARKAWLKKKDPEQVEEMLK